jgi:hypothetical protein
MPERIDDPELLDDDSLWRRIPNNQESIAKLPDGEVRPSSAAFTDELSGELSVFVVKLKTGESVLEGRPDQGLVHIKAAIPRQLLNIVGLTPEVEDIAHRVIVPGPNHLGASRKSDARKMAKAAVWVVLPESCRPERIA